MIAIGICDDEAICRKEIRCLLEKYMGRTGLDYVVREYASAEELLVMNERLSFLFLDVEMNRISGIELKEQLVDESMKIVFVTKHDESMPQAFGRNVYGFLEKPIDEMLFIKYLGRMVMDLEDEFLYLFRNGKEEFGVRMKDIIFLRALRKYSKIRTTKGEKFVTEELKTIEERLPGNTFYRCHKSYLVNMYHIDVIHNPLVLVNGDEIPVSRKKIHGLKDEYRKYILRKAR